VTVAERLPGPTQTPKAATTLRGVAVPSTSSRTGPSGPVTKTPKETASGKKGASALKRVASTPGVVERTPAKTASVAGTAGASSRKKSKKVEKGVGVETPTPVQSRSVTRARLPVTPTTPASAVHPAESKTSMRKTAGKKKAAKPVRAGTEVPSFNQPPAQSKRRKKSAIRRRLPRTAAVGVTAVPVGGAEAPKVAEIMRRVREGVPSVTATFGIKEIRPKRTANGGILLEIPGAQAASQADALAKHIREIFPEGSGVRVSRPTRKVDLRLTGFDESFTPEEIASAVSGYGGGCDAD